MLGLGDVLVGQEKICIQKQPIEWHKEAFTPSYIMGPDIWDDKGIFPNKVHPKQVTQGLDQENRP